MDELGIVEDIKDSFKEIFHYKDISRAYYLLLFLGGSRFLIELCMGLVSMVATKTVLQNNIGYGWSVPEYIQLGIMLYAVALAFMHDLLHEKSLAQLPKILVIELVMCHSIEFAEIIGNHLVFFIIFAIVAVVACIAILGSAEAISTIIIMSLIPGVGAALANTALIVLLMIAAAIFSGITYI